jgi:hypothetical protein
VFQNLKSQNFNVVLHREKNLRCHSHKFRNV